MFKSIILCSILMLFACSDDDAPETQENGKIYKESSAEQNLLRAMQLTDKVIATNFAGEDMKMARYYNPYTELASSETGSIWMYTSGIEAVNAIMHGLKAQKDKGNSSLYDQHFNRYAQLFDDLFENADYYKGTYELTSYTQTKEWSIYAVDRADFKGTADVAGKNHKNNVYDDQEWFVRELLEAYKLTGKEKYLAEAEYLTEYVLDGWDCTLDENGKENGGITWGPGYLGKQSCSNGPMISPLVWLYELYKDKNDEITYRYIKADKKRDTQTVKKRDYYLNFAKKIYDWQKSKLKTDDGVYYDMLGWKGEGEIVAYETVDGITYRANTPEGSPSGTPLSYNSGSMLSAAADLYRATGDNTYLEDAKELTDNSFNYFAKKNSEGLYVYAISGFNNWFNNVLMRAYVDIYPSYKGASEAIESFQKNLDYGYDNFLYKSMLPTNLLLGWNRETGRNDTEAMFIFSFAAEYATLARYEVEK